MTTSSQNQLNKREKEVLNVLKEQLGLESFPIKEITDKTNEACIQVEKNRVIGLSLDTCDLSTIFDNSPEPQPNEIVRNIIKLQNLRILSMKNTKIKGIPREFKKLRRLKKVYLTETAKGEKDELLELMVSLTETAKEEKDELLELMVSLTETAKEEEDREALELPPDTYYELNEDHILKYLENRLKKPLPRIFIPKEIREKDRKIERSKKVETIIDELKEIPEEMLGKLKNYIDNGLPKDKILKREKIQKSPEDSQLELFFKQYGEIPKIVISKLLLLYQTEDLEETEPQMIRALIARLFYEITKESQILTIMTPFESEIKKITEQELELQIKNCLKETIKRTTAYQILFKGKKITTEELVNKLEEVKPDELTEELKLEKITTGKKLSGIVSRKKEEREQANKTTEVYHTIVLVQSVYKELNKEKKTKARSKLLSLYFNQEIRINQGKLREEVGKTLKTIDKEVGEELEVIKKLEEKGNIQLTKTEKIEEEGTTQVVEIHKGHISGIKITGLDLGELKDLEEIANLKKIRYINLQSNRLASLPESIGNLVNLQKLELQVNQLTSLPETFFQLTNLQNLDLGGNKFTSLPETFGNLRNLKKLYLSNNELTSLPASIGNLKTLQNLDLRWNQLSCLPVSIGNLKNLQTLILYRNQLTSLPETFFELTNLRALSLEDNNFTSLPASFGNLTKLETLWLQGNQLSSLPANLKEFFKKMQAKGCTISGVSHLMD